MQDFDFHKVIYSCPKSYVGKRTLSKIIGIDSEAYTDGTPFMFPTSLGEVLSPKEWPRVLCRKAYRSANFVVWNLRYDSGAFLHHLPTGAIRVLRVLGTVEVDGWRYSYIPHKRLSISRAGNRATFWDVQPFYESSLDAAALTHLGEGKMELPTKKFTRKYVRQHWDRIRLYGIRDAQLTQRLAERLIAGLERFDLKVNSLYSQASVSQRYFTQEVGIVDVWKAWRNRPMSLMYACDAYWGGKFEPTQRGRFEGRQYDVKSAYPCEMSRLVDVQDAKITRRKTRPDSARYGYVRAHFKIPPRVLHSIPVRVSNVSIFPCGEFQATVTLNELEDLRRQRVDVKVLDGFWLTCRTDRRPYAKVIQHLWRMKEGAGAADPWVRRLAKKLLNSYYGKMIQMTPSFQPKDRAAFIAAVMAGKEYDGEVRKWLRAGMCWNPFYAAVITANTRLAVTRAQRRLGNQSIAVHTDSVLTTGTIPKSWMGRGLGQWALEHEGEGLLIGSGVYDIGKKVAFRGLKVRDGLTWRQRLTQARHKYQVKVPVLTVPSLLGAVQRGRRRLANVFIEDEKTLDLNCDVKRIWDRQACASSLLKGLSGSLPQAIIR